MLDLDHRNLRHIELLCCKDPGVTDHHSSGVVNHDRHNKPELADTVRDLIDLTLGMLSRVTGIESEIAYGSILDLNLNQAGIGRDITASL